MAINWRSSLANSAHAGEQEGVGEPIALDRIAQRLHHRLLPDQLGEALRAVFAGKDAIAFGPLGLRRLVEAKEGIGHQLSPSRSG